MFLKMVKMQFLGLPALAKLLKTGPVFGPESNAVDVLKPITRQ
jgi:hypothetical protein